MPPAKILYHKAEVLAASGDRELIVLRDDADGDTVKSWDGSRESVCFNGRSHSEKICEQEAECRQCSSADHIAPRKGQREVLAITNRTISPPLPDRRTPFKRRKRGCGIGA